MTLSEETVKHIALLARLGLSEDEVKNFGKELSSVLDFFQELEKYVLSAEGRDSDFSGKMRPDREEPCPLEKRNIIKKNFPANKNNYLKVRSIFSV